MKLKRLPIAVIYRCAVTGLVLQWLCVGQVRALPDKPKHRKTPVSAQNDDKMVAITITGVVKGDDGEVLPGVNVVEKGTMNGISTDRDGKYKITVSGANSVLIFSYIGYVSQESPVGAKRNIDIKLIAENKSLQEVVVVGYGTQRKESVVGAITQVDNKALMRSGTSNVTNALAGKLSGVLTMQQSGEPGSDHSEIVIRGLSSWNGSQPVSYTHLTLPTKRIV